MKTLSLLVLSLAVTIYAAKPGNVEKYVSKHPHGELLKVVKFTGQQWSADKEILDKLLTQPEVVNRDIVTISTTGTTKNGKSTFMDYCLRYMYANYDSVNAKRNGSSDAEWLGPAEEPLTGFSDLKGSSMRVSGGIHVWSDVFLHKTEDGKELAIVLIESQGFPDKKFKSLTEKLFTFNLLTSSMQVNSVTNLHRPSQLKYLKVATDFTDYYGKQSVHELKPFQDVLILLRDWKKPEPFKFGLEGGKNYIKHVFETEKTLKNNSLQLVGSQIDKTFESFTGSLMPHPGNNFTGSTGSWGNMTEEFVDGLKEVIPALLKPEILKVKKLGDVTVNAHEFAEAIHNFYPILESKEDVVNKDTFDTLEKAQKKLLSTKMASKYREKTLELIKNAQKSLKNSVHEEFDKYKVITAKTEPDANETTQEASDDLMDEIYDQLEKKLLETGNKYEKEIKQLNSELEEKNQEVEKAKKEIEAKNTEISNLNEQIVNVRDALKKEIEKKDEEIAMKNEDIAKVLKELEEKNRKLFMIQNSDDEDDRDGSGDDFMN